VIPHSPKNTLSPNEINKVLRNLDVSKLNFIETSCDFCRSNESCLVYSVSFLNLEFRFVRCSTCNLIYQNPMLDKASRSHIYETIEYWNHKGTDSRSPTMLNYYSYLSDKRTRWQTDEIRTKWVCSRLQKNDRVLDLGCSDGLFVEALSQAGFRVTGMDISASMVTHGRKKGHLELIQSDFEKDWPFQEPFDAITCYATLSNFSSASKVFEQIQRHLRPGGHFFFNFGDAQRPVSRILGSRLYLYRPTATLIYSKKVIQNYCQKFGLKILEMKNDVQVVPLARLCGFLRIPGLLKIIEFADLQDTRLKMTLPTGYMACVVKESI